MSGKRGQGFTRILVLWRILDLTFGMQSTGKSANLHEESSVFSGRIAPLKEYSVEILGLLAYSHPFYAGHKFEFSPKAFPCFYRFVEKTFEAHPEIETWEILNESNLTKYFEARDSGSHLSEPASLDSPGFFGA